VPDVDAAIDYAREHGATVLVEPHDCRTSTGPCVRHHRDLRRTGTPSSIGPRTTALLLPGFVSREPMVAQPAHHPKRYFQRSTLRRQRRARQMDEWVRFYNGSWASPTWRSSSATTSRPSTRRS
jgi:4-hydroxyphenylpyruvate dioxygenase